MVQLARILNCLPLQMFYRVVLIFADTKDLAAFVDYSRKAGQVYGSDYTFVGVLSEEEIRIAREKFGAYVRVAKINE